MVTVCPVVFSADAAYDPETWRGDFRQILRTNLLEKEIVVFNDNFADRKSPFAGAGNAVVRPYARTTPPRAIGIPTGWTSGKGFDRLSSDVQEAIDLALERLAHLVKALAIDRIFYSAVADGDATLGTDTFSVDDDVVRYITRALNGFASRVPLARDPTLIDASETALEIRLRAVGGGGGHTPMISNFFAPTGDREAAAVSRPVLRISSSKRKERLPPSNASSSKASGSTLVSSSSTTAREGVLYVPGVGPYKERSAYERLSGDTGRVGGTSQSARFGLVLPEDASKTTAYETLSRPRPLAPRKKHPMATAAREEQRGRMVALIGYDPRLAPAAAISSMSPQLRALAQPKPAPACAADLRAHFAPSLDRIDGPLPRVDTPRVLSVFDARDFDAIGDILPDEYDGSDSPWQRKVDEWNSYVAAHTSSTSSS